MTGFSRIEIDGFRRLRGIDLEMRPLCALIGANGSGKTSFLEAFSLLAASAQGGFASKISDSGGIQALARIGGGPRLAILFPAEPAHILFLPLQRSPGGPSP